MKRSKKALALVLAALMLCMCAPSLAGAAGDLGFGGNVTLSDFGFAKYNNTTLGYDDVDPDTHKLQHGVTYRMTFDWKLKSGTPLEQNDYFTIPLSFTEDVRIYMPNGNTGTFDAGDSTKAGTLTVAPYSVFQKDYTIEVKFTESAPFSPTGYFTENPNNISGTVNFEFIFYVESSHSTITWDIGGTQFEWKEGSTGPIPGTGPAVDPSLDSWKYGLFNDTLRNLNAGAWSFMINETADTFLDPNTTVKAIDTMSPGQELSPLRQTDSPTEAIALVAGEDGIFGIDGNSAPNTVGEKGYFKLYEVDYAAAYDFYNSLQTDPKNILDKEVFIKGGTETGEIHASIQSMVAELVIFYPFTGQQTIRWTKVDGAAVSASGIFTPASEDIIQDATLTNDPGGNGFILSLDAAKLSGKRVVCQYFVTITDPSLSAFKNAVAFTGLTHNNAKTWTLNNSSISGSVVGNANTITIKKVDESGGPIDNVAFKLTKEGVSESVFLRSLTTKPDGTATTSLGLIDPNDIFVLEETAPSGYRAIPTIKFKVNPSNYEVTITDPVPLPDWLEVDNQTANKTSTLTVENEKLTTNPPGGSNSTPTPKPTPSTSPSATPSDTPTDTPTSTPTDTPATTPGQSAPPPSPSGGTLVPNEEGYEELDEDGTPLGQWTYNEETDEWIFEEYPPLGNLPNAGGTAMFFWMLALGCTLLAVGIYMEKRNCKRVDNN
ncbi:hypothetical protein LJC34_03455 [Oscillospiraceae bacterium OttesenSCG-928-G22]|nr:hypothetical protein [Oscillospiraceae bacterium OttesenSCG-928-G22]